MFKKPSDIHSCLTDESVDRIGFLIAQVRSENLDTANDRDTGWSLGCRAYTWCCSEIIELAKAESWVTIVNPTLKFIFKIGSVEISFYKGTASKPKKNIYSRAQAYPELRQLSLLSNMMVPEKLVWAYAVETDIEGLTTGIEFFGMSESGEVISSRTIPLHKVPALPSIINGTENAPKDLKPAPVSLPRPKDEKAAENDEPRKDE
ncbi:TPA: hypothetical protein ACHY2P_001378 [Pseudomonas aeruginosa]|uniref:hypothetical protein n=1 Tax=Pseudomonas aeruginosa group TaxID=136841 RepID=UPI0011C196DF|nr:MULTISPECIES: hypothetical protein [Pseudomonas aeruginosa group]MDF3933275.1 hypothetical protein [Pseudomonas citronellolis]MDI9796839.1 hypothetical protein [Pseudomonas aeruginosa]NPX94251.1 hypothetical protein [Pseudomonas aeruginosa]HBO4122736.1 hypothetical protein [Pseudomonas aeruginosa]HBO4250931.1 hypothetical protein [Pseudomonas aeruginosa]